MLGVDLGKQPCAAWAAVMMYNGMDFAIMPLLVLVPDSDARLPRHAVTTVSVLTEGDVCLCRHAATMDSSSSPEVRSPPSPLDSLAGDVRQRLMFDWQESRFGEMAEPDPLSFGSPQHAQHAQQADGAGQNMGAKSNTFQV